MRGDTSQVLTERGHDQARAVARRLGGVRVDRLVSSPVARARQTADHIAEACVAPVEVDADWREFGVPYFGGDEAPALVERLRQGRFGVDWDGEPIAEFVDRVDRALGRAFVPGTTVVVTHGGVVNAALCSVLDRPFQFAMYAANTSVTQLLGSPDGGRELGVVNDASHLGDALVARPTTLFDAFGRLAVG